MTEDPKTPKRTVRNRRAPTIQTPSRVGVSPSTATGKEIRTPKPRAVGDSLSESTLSKENVKNGNLESVKKSTKDRKAVIAKKSQDASTTKKPLTQPQTLKIKTSRDAAELVALLKTASDMKVLEVKSSQKLDEDSFRELVKLKVPIVFRGYASGWPCVKNWCKPGYLELAAREESANLPHRKYRQFVAHSEESGRLHLTDGKSKAKSASLSEFLESTKQDKSTNGLYLLGIHAVGGNSTFSYCPVQAHEDDKDHVPPLSRDVPHEIHILEWYAKFLAETEAESKPIKYDHQQFFLARGYAFTDLHYDSYDNFYVAASGKRRWTLACPTASRWLISSSSGKLKSGSNAIPHLKDFTPGCPAQIYPFSYIDLEPSDVLYVPNCWWHLVESCPGDDGFSSAFNFFFSKPADKVFGDFQTGLSQMEALVNSLQRECRDNLARISVPQDTVEIPEAFEKAPSTLEQSMWDTVIELASAHSIQGLVKRLHDQHTRNSVESWTQHSGRQKCQEGLKAADDSLSNRSRTATLSVQGKITPSNDVKKR